MLFFRIASVLLVASIQLVAAADGQPEFAPPDILVSAGDPGTTLQPYVGNPVGGGDAVDETKVIRELLMTRQSCPGGYGVCNDGGCCQIGGQCCGGRKCCGSGQWCYGSGCCNQNESGCEGVSCCPTGSNCCKGGGCCRPGYYCTVVNGRKGCCEDGKICTSGGGDSDSTECTNSGYVPCTGENFCCPSGYTCYRDSANTPRCSLYSTYTLTRTSTYPTLTLTSTSPRSTSTPGNGNSNNDLGDGLPNNSGSNSIGLSGLNSTSSRSSSRSSSSSSSSPSPTPSGSTSANVNGVADWKGSLTFFGIAPFFALIVYLL